VGCEFVVLVVEVTLLSHEVLDVTVGDLSLIVSAILVALYAHDFYGKSLHPVLPPGKYWDPKSQLQFCPSTSWKTTDWPMSSSERCCDFWSWDRFKLRLRASYAFLLRYCPLDYHLCYLGSYLIYGWTSFLLDCDPYLNNKCFFALSLLHETPFCCSLADALAMR